MNLRTLKKRSKQAVPFLIAHFGRKPGDFFPAERGENYHGLQIRCPHKRGQFRCDCESHPLPGTPMTGEMHGYYEPEWSERTALEDLQRFVEWGAKPATASEAEWRRIVRVAGTLPFDAKEFDRFARQSLDDDAPVED